MQKSEEGRAAPGGEGGVCPTWGRSQAAGAPPPRCRGRGPVPLGLLIGQKQPILQTSRCPSFRSFENHSEG